EKLLSCRLFAVVAGAVFMAVVILFGVPRDEKLHALSSPRKRSQLIPASAKAHINPPYFEPAGSFSGSLLGARYRSGNVAAPTPATKSDHRLRSGKLHPDGPRPLLCVVSRGAVAPRQFPKKHCTHLVYKDARYQATSGTFVPVNAATFGALKRLTEATKQKVLVAVAGLTLEELSREGWGSARFGTAVVQWLTSTGFQGIALIGQSASSDKLQALGPRFKELRSTLGKFELLLGVTVEDWDSPVHLVSSRLADIAPHVDYLVLETHFQAPKNTCHTAYSSVFYSTGTASQPTVPIGQALTWMSELLLDHKQHVVSCFSVTLGAVVFVGTDGHHAPCQGSELATYMLTIPGQNVQRDEILMDILSRCTFCFVDLDSGTGIFRRSEYMHHCSHFFFSHAVPYGIDVSDFRKVSMNKWGPLNSIRSFLTYTSPYAALAFLYALPLPKNGPKRGPPRAIHRFLSPAFSLRQPCACMASGKLLRNTTLHTQLSRCAFFGPDYLRRLASPGVKVLVALHESLLLSEKAESLAESTSVLLRGTRLDGLAFLYVTYTAAQLRALLPKLKVLHDTYVAAGLCLALSLQVLDYDVSQSEAMTSTLGDVSRHVDVLVLNTHNPGTLGPCRAVPSTVAVQPKAPCLPTLALDTALGLARSIDETSAETPFLCLSVDMRALRFGMYGSVSVHGACSSLVAHDLAAACSDAAWAPVHNVSRESIVWRKGSLLQTFDTAQALRERVQTIAALPNTCVAAFNYDYDDFTGVCDDGVPHARLLAIREALGATRPLVCTLSPGVQDESRVPSSHCTHLVHEGVAFDPWARKLNIPESCLWVVASRPAIKHLVGIGGEQVVDGLLGASAKELGEAAVALSSAVLAAKMDGVAILNFNRTSKTISEFGQVLAVLRGGMAKGLELVLGVEVLDMGLPTDVASRRLSDVAKHVDILVLQTHYRRARGYCQLAYPSVDQGPASTLTLSTATRWAQRLDGGAHVCVSFTMAVLQFSTLENSSRGCGKISMLDYGVTCDDKDWSLDAKSSPALVVVRRKKGLVQTFESADYLADKVQNRTGLCCLCAPNDGDGCILCCRFCGIEGSLLLFLKNRHFVVLSTLHFNYITSKKKERKKERTCRKLTPSCLIRDDEKKLSTNAGPSSLHSRPISFPARTTVYRADTVQAPDQRPFVCLLSSSWRGDAASLPTPLCTHVLVDVDLFRNESDAGSESVLTGHLKSKPGPSVQLFVRTTRWQRLGRPDTTSLLLRSLRRTGARGVAVTDVNIFSAEIPPLVLELEGLLGVLPKPSSLLLGLDLADWDQQKEQVAQRIDTLLGGKLVDLLILQTHFTSHWRFCRAAHASLYAQPTDDACLQST
ncbi:unnamed protein product, partial [Ixodes hexagonus]